MFLNTLVERPSGDFTNVAPNTILLVQFLATLQQREEFHHLSLPKELAKLVQDVRVTENFFPILRTNLFERLLDVVKHLSMVLLNVHGIQK
jgi:hypothetical protein